MIAPGRLRGDPRRADREARGARRPTEGRSIGTRVLKPEDLYHDGRGASPPTCSSTSATSAGARSARSARPRSTRSRTTPAPTTPTTPSSASPIFAGPGMPAAVPARRAPVRHRAHRADRARPARARGHAGPEPRLIDAAALLDELRTLAYEGRAYAESEYDQARYRRMCQIVDEFYADLAGLPAGRGGCAVRARPGHADAEGGGDRGDRRRRGPGAARPPRRRRPLGPPRRLAGIERVAGAGRRPRGGRGDGPRCRGGAAGHGRVSAGVAPGGAARPGGPGLRLPHPRRRAAPSHESLELAWRDPRDPAIEWHVDHGERVLRVLAAE